jgi:rfaE bifunctional protein nucleotidyltransferase chain/domain/rfaE bifunctional protein kinase chain/domain
VTRDIVVVGDVLLDVDVHAEADRLVPDAAAPVLTEQHRDVRPGGAALTALLAARRSGARVTLIAPLPDDDAATRIRRRLADTVEVVAVRARGATPVKTRLRARGHTVARLDSGGGVEIEEVPAAALEALARADAVLVSDYGGAAARNESLRAAFGAERPLIWDPHPRGASPVSGATLVTPNLAEAVAASGLSVASSDLVRARSAAEALLTRWQARSVAVTLGERGALLSFGTGSSEIYPVSVPSTGDPCGAGDCFAATAAVVLAEGGLPSRAVAAAVEAASDFVASGGVAALEAGAPSGSDVVSRVRARGGTVVATGGCFDLLHPGHIRTLAAARALGDCLVVLLNSDASVRRAKGEGRPLQRQEDRVRVLEALAAVDTVMIFDEDTPETALRVLRPDVWVKGGDYAGHELPEAEAVRSWGGEVVTVGYLDGRSTSRLVEQARR